jgi:cytochrome c peroxidase
MKRASSTLGVLGVTLVVGALGACVDETTFTQEERETLASFKVPAAPPANPSNRVADSRDAAVLGKMLFFDKRFSGSLGPANDGVTGGSLGTAGATGKVACVDCHDVSFGGADRRSRTPTSLGSNYGLRNAPTVINAAMWDVSVGGWQLWDGRKDSLWSLALGPWEGGNEHNGTRLQYAHFIYTNQTYKMLYEKAFVVNENDPNDLGRMPPMDALQPDGVTPRFPPTGKPGQPAFDMMAAADKTAITRFYSNLGKAIEAYERLLVSPNYEPSPFDQMLTALEQGRDDDVLTIMSPAAIRGAKLFIGKAACNECHRGPMLTDFSFHNIGCPQQGQNVPAIDVGRQGKAMFMKNDPMNRSGAFSDAVDDSHITQLMDQEALESNLLLGSFRTPTLRNIDKTQPYMHDGVYTNLWDVVSHYNFGGGTGSFSGAKEAAISPLLMSNDELDDLVEFLRTLTDGSPLAHPDFPEGLVAAPTLPQ